MASNLKNNTVKSLKDLNKLVNRAALNKASPAMMLPAIPTLQVQSTEAVQELEVAINERCKQLSENALALGKALGDDSTLEHNLAQINTFEDELVQLITSVESEMVRRRMANAFYAALVAVVPQNFTGLVHLTKLGEGLRILQRQENASLTLPVLNGRCDWITFNCPRQYAKQVEALAKVVSDANLARRRAQLEELKDGASSDLLEVLEKGGEAVVYCPPAGEKYPGGNVRVKVADGVVIPISAVGGCAKVVNEAAQSDVSLPVNSLKDQRIQLKTRLEERRFKLTIIVHSILHRGYKAAVTAKAETERLNALQSKVTVKMQDLVLKGAVGIAHAHFKEWEYKLGEEQVMYKNVNFLVERNEAGELRVAGMFEEQKELFTGCLEFKASGEKFSGLPSPLAQMMRTLFAIFSNKERKAAEQAKVVDEAAKQADLKNWVEADKKSQEAVNNPA